MRIDRAVGAEVTARLQPLGVEAAIGAMHAGMPIRAEKRRQVELALEQARYEAARARRQYDAVDPDNRLVAGELEQSPVSWSIAAERERLLALGDVERAWHSAGATPATRKRIIRTRSRRSSSGSWMTPSIW
jgi:hypothetical protein